MNRNIFIQYLQLQISIENLKFESSLETFDDFLKLDYNTDLKRIIYEKYQQNVDIDSAFNLNHHGLQMLKFDDDNFDLTLNL